MRMSLTCFLAVVCCVIAWSGSRVVAQGGKTDARGQKAVAKVKTMLAAKSRVAPQLAAIDSKDLRQLFPNYSFVSARYRQYPVAVAPPQGMRSSNIVMVPDQGKPQIVTDKAALQKFFQAQFQQQKTNRSPANAEAAARGWLTLDHELIQDGFYKFDIVRTQVKLRDDGSVQADGRSVVMQGGNGEINVTVKLPKSGKIQINDEQKIRPGPRPRCQATKLLDADPIVRYMAETELLFMGRPALPYLLEQRAKAAGSLRRAIDAIRQKIEANGY